MSIRFFLVPWGDPPYSASMVSTPIVTSSLCNVFFSLLCTFFFFLETKKKEDFRCWFEKTRYFLMSLLTELKTSHLELVLSIAARSSLFAVFVGNQRT